MLPVEASPTPPCDGDAFDLSIYGHLATVIMSGGHEHVTISDGLRRIRIDVVRGTLMCGPVRFRYLLEGFADLDAKVLTLNRLFAFRRLGRFARRLHPREHQAPRWVAALRVHDAILDGASQPEIARVLFGARVSGSSADDRSHSLRLRVQRLGRIGRDMTKDRYRALLR